jgi:uncharacterized cupin superfamily protein
MDFVNAIAKARFASAKPQRVQLHRGSSILVEMLCLEGGQKVSQTEGDWAYYVVAGKAAVVCGGKTTELPAGQFAAALDESHSLQAMGEQRLICLAVSSAK